MKTTVIFYIFIIFSLSSCKKDTDSTFESENNISACGVNDPINQLKWLNQKITKGQNTATSDFVESVWVKQFDGEDIIVINFGLTSSMYSTFNCSGKTINIQNQDFFNSLSEDLLIYKYK